MSIIDRPEVVKKILPHLGLREKQKPPPKITLPPSDYFTAEQINSYDSIDPD